jgi:antitoxin component YwqK of YwqJK toxin-antitoxin module
MKKTIILHVLVFVFRFCSAQNENNMKDKEIILLVSEQKGHNTLDPFFQENFDNFFYMDGTIVYLKETNGKYTGTIKVIYPSAKTCSIWNYKDGEMNGEQLIYYENGEKLSVFNVINALGEGKQYNYYDNGTLQRIYTMKEGKIEGYSINYFKNGKKESEGNLIANDFHWEDKIGHWIYYYENGNKKEEGNWGMGGRHGNTNTQIGIWKYYDEKGCLFEIIEYDNFGRKKD